ncbi:hypothetical protein IVZ55_28035 [Salmonella enterica subsp. enterica serovar Worthington]|nr:hypothetical protein [Salmonella enterica subsp. enterica serovar Worthington]
MKNNHRLLVTGGTLKEHSVVIIPEIFQQGRSLNLNWIIPAMCNVLAMHLQTKICCSGTKDDQHQGNSIPVQSYERQPPSFESWDVLQEYPLPRQERFRQLHNLKK